MEEKVALLNSRTVQRRLRFRFFLKLSTAGLFLSQSLLISIESSSDLLILRLKSWIHIYQQIKISKRVIQAYCMFSNDIRCSHLVLRPSVGRFY